MDNSLQWFSLIWKNKINSINKCSKYVINFFCILKIAIYDRHLNYFLATIIFLLCVYLLIIKLMHINIMIITT